MKKNIFVFVLLLLSIIIFSFLGNIKLDFSHILFGNIFQHETITTIILGSSLFLSGKNLIDILNK